ncbi:MAG TPA: hypothetical protein VL857_08800 [Candidatus Eisenbacteria bacterium]|jgi:hypothetical protein|nr:hypothetical protein [Candidatus Eisenbacteria bacterium]
MKRSVWVLVTAVAVLSLGASTGARSASGSDPAAEVRAMARAILDAPEVMSDVVLERSDPFGGQPDVERGKLWYLPGRGIRLKSSQTNGHDMVVDRAKEKFYLYSPSENVIYQASFEKAPARIRRLILDPDRVLDKNLRAVEQSRTIHGRSRRGYQILSTGLGDSLTSVAIWVAADPSTRQLHWLSISTPADSLLIELRALTIRKKAEPGHLTLSAPASATEQPLDPQEMLGRESR